MEMRFAKALALSTALALPLLGACGGSTAPAGSPAPSAAAPASSAAAEPSSDAASPSQSAAPVDETKNVQAAATTFIKAVFAVDARQTNEDYQKRVKPLMTKQGYASVEDAKLDQATELFRTRYGKQSRNVTELRKTARVEKLTAEKATVEVTYKNRIQQRSDGEWRTVKSEAEDSIKVPLVKQDGRWLVDDLS